MADLDKIKRNVGRMVDQNAPVEHIDEYIRSEGVTLDQVKSHKPRPAAPVNAPVHEGGGQGPGRFARPQQPSGGDSGFLNQMIGNIPSGVMGTLDSADYLPTNLGVTLFRKGMGLPSRKDAYDASSFAPPKPVSGNEKLGATVGEFIGNSILPSGAWIGGSMNLARSAAQPATSWLGQFIQRAAEETAKHPVKAAGFDLASAITGGTAKNWAEEEGYGTGGQTLAALAGGMVPALPGLIRVSPVGDAYRYMTGRGAAARKAFEEQQALWQDAGVRQFAPAMVDNPIMRATAQGGAGSILGGALRKEAGAAIDDTLSRARQMINARTSGEPFDDVAAGLQQNLRESLLERSMPRARLEELPPDAFDRITGPITEAGFMPHSPVIKEVQPREVPMVQPRRVDPAEIKIDPVPQREVPWNPPEFRYTEPHQIKPDPEDFRKVAAIEREVGAYQDTMRTLKQSLDAMAAERNTTPEALFNEIQIDVLKGEGTHPGSQLYKDITSAYENLLQRREALQEAQSSLAMNRDAAYLNTRMREEREAKRQFMERAKAHQEETLAAQREADAATQKLRAEALRKAQIAAEEEAAARNFDLQQQARQEAEQINKTTRDAAMKRWEEEVANQPGFRVGRSRESYLTELDAGYERAGRAMPNEPFNPMGGPTPEGRAAKTQLRALMKEFEAEGRRSLRLGGSGFDETGGMTTEFRDYLRGRIGASIADRLYGLSHIAPGHSATSPRGIRELRTEIRRAAEDAERPLLPGDVRSTDAAALRRMHGALSEDIADFTRRSGGPAEKFATETAPGRYVPRENELPRSTVIGDRRPSDVTIYLTDENLERLAGSKMPYDHSGRMLGEKMFDIDGRAIQIKNLRTSQIDKSTRVPFSTKPEPGLRPVQIWEDGTVHYGSPITSRSPSPGEHAATLMGQVDREYGRFFEELRRPLARLYGDKVTPIEAMQRISKAADAGDLSTLRPFMRVMREKGDPEKAAIAIIAHKTNGARTLNDFIKGIDEIHPDALREIFRGQNGDYVLRQFKDLRRIAARLAPYEDAISGGVRVRGLDVSNPANIAIGAAMMSNFVMTMFGVATAASVARFMASPKYVTWLTRGARITDEQQWKRHIVQLSKFATHDDTGLGSDIKKAIKKAGLGSMDMRANAMSGGGNGPDAHPFQPLFDAAKTKGIDHTKASPQEVIDAAWDASPTDQMGEMIDEIAKQMNLTPPWERKK